jgi:ankyrin repeat protein
LESANNDGCRTLNSAAFNSHVEVVQELVKHGPKVESADKYGWTTLKTAATNGHKDVVRELQKHGASV